MTDRSDTPPGDDSQHQDIDETSPELHASSEIHELTTRPRDDLTPPLPAPDAQRVGPDDLARKEATRWILLIFSVMLGLGAGAAIAGGSVWVNVKEFLEFTLAGVTGLVGLVIGYYFGRDKSGPS